MQVERVPGQALLVLIHIYSDGSWMLSLRRRLLQVPKQAYNEKPVASGEQCYSEIRLISSEYSALGAHTFYGHLWMADGSIWPKGAEKGGKK